MGRVVVALAVVTVLAGCPFARKPGPYDPLLLELREDPIPLPEGIDALLTAADAAAAHGPDRKHLERALRCANAVLADHPKHEAAAWRAARSLYYLSELDDAVDDQAVLSAHCMDAAAIAMVSGQSAEGHYWSALCMGARARARNLEGIDLVPKMVKVGQKAVALDPKIEHGGPNRLLGGIYLRAPAWPTSVGDLDEALDHLERAVAIDDSWAENQLLWAEALLADDRLDEARAALERAEALMAAPGMEHWARLWKGDVDKVRRRLAEER